jgi:hypothetical protein
MKTENSNSTKADVYLLDVEKYLEANGVTDHAELIDELKTHLEILLSEDSAIDLNVALGTPEIYGKKLIQALGEEYENSFKTGKKTAKYRFAIAMGLAISVTGVAGYLGFLRLPSNEDFPVKDRYYTTPNLVGMDPLAAIEKLSPNKDNIPICNLPDFVNVDLAKTKIIGQSPIVGEVINPAMQCISLQLEKK